MSESGASAWDRLTSPSNRLVGSRKRIHLRFFTGLVLMSIPTMWLTVGVSAALGEAWRPKAAAAVGSSVLALIAYAMLRSGKGTRATKPLAVASVVLAVASFPLLGNWSLFYTIAAVAVAATVLRRQALAWVGMAAFVGHALLGVHGPFDFVSLEESWSAGFGGLLIITTTSVLYARYREHLNAWERRQARELEIRRRRLFALAFDGFLVADGNVISDVNPGFCRIFRRRREDLVGCDIMQLFAQESLSRIRGVLEGSVTGSIEVRGIRGDGSVRDLEIVVQHEPGAVSSSYVAVRDVTRRKQAEARLSIADRAVSTGTLAAGVAHEINNPLSYLITNLSLVEAALRSDRLHEDRETLRRSIVEAQEGAERVRSVVADLRALSRVEDLEIGSTDVEDALELAVRMAQRSIEMRAMLVRDYEPIPPCEAHRARLGQVFLNLLTNAAQAIPEGDPSRHRVEVRTRAAGDEIVVEIRDTGVGMSAEVQRRVFDPFFTTKAVNEGTGLGMSIVHGIVTGFGGRIELDSALGEGTTVRVYLPAAEPDSVVPRRVEPEAERSDLVAGGAKILIVDDEPLVRTSLTRALSGHEITAVSSGRQALEAVAGRTFDLVICDVMMPDVGGAELYSLLRDRDPRLAAKMIFITGGAFTPATRAFLDAVPNPVLEKPFELAALRDTVAGMVERPVGIA